MRYVYLFIAACVVALYLTADPCELPDGSVDSQCVANR